MSRWLSLLFACLLSSAAWAGDSAVLLRDTSLRADHYSDAAVVAKLPARQAVELGERSGGWYHVDAAGKQGWLRMTSVRVVGRGTAKQGDSGVAEALGLVTTGRSGSSGVTVATGIRGLDEATMARATPNFSAVAQLDRLGVSPSTARAFARQGRLVEHQVAYSERADGVGGGGGRTGSAPKAKNNSPFGDLSW